MTDWGPLVEVIALCGSLPTRLLEIHVNDGTGRCEVCNHNQQHGRDKWPCSTRELATRAVVRQGQIRMALEHPGVIRVEPGYGPERPDRQD